MKSHRTGLKYMSKIDFLPGTKKWWYIQIRIVIDVNLICSRGNQLRILGGIFGGILVVYRWYARWYLRWYIQIRICIDVNLICSRGNQLRRRGLFLQLTLCAHNRFASCPSKILGGAFKTPLFAENQHRTNLGSWP